MYKLVFVFIVFKRGISYNQQLISLVHLLLTLSLPEITRDLIVVRENLVRPIKDLLLRMFEINDRIKLTNDIYELISNLAKTASLRINSIFNENIILPNVSDYKTNYLSFYIKFIRKRNKKKKKKKYL